MRETVILGAGLAGLSAAHHLRTDYELFEREAHAGGLVVTHERDGFRFDVTGHWLHMRDEGIRRMMETLMPGRWTQVVRDSRIFSKGVETIYPFQTNTYGLPVDVVKEIVGGFIDAVYVNPPKAEPRSFEDWVLKHMGPGIARHFMIPYNEKLWCIHPRDMTPHWCQHYVPKPTLDQILDGALRRPEERIGYNATFSYPKRGGIGAMSKALAGAVDAAHVNYNTQPAAIHAKKKRIRLSNGGTIGYRNLVSTIPLPELVRLIGDAPARVRAAAAKLVHNQVFYFNVALEGRPGSPAHWIYFPEKEFVFYRVGCYSNAVRSMAPKGMSSLYVEISHRGDLPPAKTLWKASLDGLLRSSVVPKKSSVLFYEPCNIEYAYVVFDRHYAQSLAVIFPWLERQDILSIGRYGRWTYNSMETALTDGRDAARRIAEKR